MWRFDYLNHRVYCLRASVIIDKDNKSRISPAEGGWIDAHGGGDGGLSYFPHYNYYYY